MLKKLNLNLLFIAAVLVLTVPALIGLLHPGFPLTDDGNWMVIRFSAFFQTLRAGQFPVRFLMRLNNGYGYPVADFLYPLFMYFAVPIHIVGINFVNTIKIVLVLCLLSSSLFSFLWLRKLFNNFSSLVGALLYTFFPYHLYDVYKRGSVGEVLALSILPFILWQIERRSLIWVSIGIASLVVAHNTLAALFLLLLIPYVLLDVFVAKDKLHATLFHFASFALGALMSSFFWLPAIYDLQYTVFSKTQISNITNYFLNFDLIGFATIFIILFVIIFMVNRLIKIKQHRLTVLMLVVAVFSIYFASSFSGFLWRFLPSSLVQFPFRFLSLTIPSVAFLAACLVSVLPPKKQVAMGIILLLLIFFSAITYSLPKTYQYYPDSFYSTNQDSTTVKNEYMPKWVEQIPVAMAPAKVQNLSGKETINLLQVTPNKTVFSANLNNQGIIQVNTVYFPGWYATVNGKPAKILDNNSSGLINLQLQKGQNNVKVFWQETPLRMLADFVSLAGFIILLIMYYFRKRLKYENF